MAMLATYYNNSEAVRAAWGQADAELRASYGELAGAFVATEGAQALALLDWYAAQVGDAGLSPETKSAFFAAEAGRREGPATAAAARLAAPRHFYADVRGRVRDRFEVRAQAAAARLAAAYAAV